MSRTMDIYNDVARLTANLMPDKDVTVSKITKNNGIKRFGVVVKGSNMEIGPVFYLEDKIEAGWTVEALADFVVEAYKHNDATEVIDILDVIHSYEAAKGYLTVQLISKERNFETLRDTPYRDFLDLAVIIAITYPLPDGGNGRVVVNNGILGLWSISFEEVYDVAMANLSLKQPKFFDLYDLVRDLDPEIGEMWDESGYLYVLTNLNESESYGASQILRPGYLDILAEKLNSDLILIPSSVHEWIILRDCDRVHAQFHERELAEMIENVNENVLDETDILSNHAYFWSRKGGWSF